MCRPQLLTSQVRVCGGALASGGVKPPDGAAVAHSLRAAGRACGYGARRPHERSREAGDVLPGLRHVLAQSVVPSLWLCPWRTFGSVWGESGCLSVGAGGGGGGGCLWNLVGRGQRSASTAEIVPRAHCAEAGKVACWLSGLGVTGVARRFSNRRCAVLVTWVLVFCSTFDLVISSFEFCMLRPRIII